MAHTPRENDYNASPNRSVDCCARRIMLAVLAVLSCLCLASRPVRGGNLIVNGSFESPSATSSGKIIEVFSGSEPAGFTWNVTSGTVEITQQGYVDPAGQVFAGPAFQGSQWLDLDGISPGAIAQTFATTPGTLYALSFAYANNPFRTTPPTAETRRRRLRLLTPPRMTISPTFRSPTIPRQETTTTGPCPDRCSSSPQELALRYRSCPMTPRGVTREFSWTA